MSKISNPEWRDELDSTRYPFVDDATLTSETGNVLSELLFIDATLYPIGATLPLRLSKVVVTSSRVTVYVSDTDDNVVISSTFATNSIPENLKLTDSYDRDAGLLVSSSVRLATLLGLPTGTHLFSESATEFVLACCTPLPDAGVVGFLLDDGSVLNGDVVLVAADGIVFTHSTVTYAGGGTYYDNVELEQIKIDVVGDPLFRRRLCTASDQFVSPQFIQRICITTPEITAVGDLDAVEAHKFCIAPDAFGDIKIIAGTQDASDSVLRVYPVDEGLMFRTIGEKTKE